MSTESGIEDDLTIRQDVRSVAVVDHGRRHQAEAGVVVLVVVPLEERLAEATSVFDGAEAVREARAVFESSELAFRIRIVIRDMRAAVGFDDAQIGQQQRHRFRFHGRAANRQSPPRQIPDVEGFSPRFGDNGEIFFNKREGTSSQAYRVHEDGTGLRSLGEQIMAVIGVSQDKRWVVSKVSEGRSLMAFPTDGSPGRVIGPAVDGHFAWSHDGRLLFVSVPEGPLASGIVGRTYVISLQPGQILPSIPAGGFQTMDDLSKLPGVRVIEAYGAAPGPTSDVYAFARSSVQRNLYRIPIP